MTFRERLIELRAAGGFTQESLAEASGVSLSMVRKLEQGDRTKVSLAVAAKLARALGTDCTAFAGCEDVAGGEDEPAPKGKGRKGKAG